MPWLQSALTQNPRCPCPLVALSSLRHKLGIISFLLREILAFAATK